MWIFILLLIIAALAALLFVPRLQGYRTVLFGYMTAIVGAVLPLANDIFGYLQGLDWRQYVSPERAPYIIAAISVLVIVLRYATKGPVGSK